MSDNDVSSATDINRRGRQTVDDEVDEDDDDEDDDEGDASSLFDLDLPFPDGRYPRASSPFRLR